jgi:hypothetical protein
MLFAGTLARRSCPFDQYNVPVIQIIGTTTKYRGTERRHLRGHIVEIVAIVKNALVRNNPRIVVTDEEIRATGGVTTLDRVVVAVITPGGGQVRVGGAVRAIDLECFARLLRARGTA